MNKAIVIGLILLVGLTASAFLWPQSKRSTELIAEDGLKKVAFGAGCFWGVEKIFGALDGVVDTRVGYMGGNLIDPTYDQVCSGNTGHAEVVDILYDPTKITFRELVVTFFEWHDPTTLNRQGPDVGSQYRSAIFYYDEDQKLFASEAIDKLNETRIFKNKIVTEVKAAEKFYIAENYHQQYLKKNPNGYCSHSLDKPNVREVI